MTHIVKAPLALAQAEDGSFLYLYFGTQVPANVSDEEIERLGDAVESVDDEKPKRGRKPASDSSDSE